jgi:hypothetical protein
MTTENKTDNIDLYADMYARFPYPKNYQPFIYEGFKKNVLIYHDFENADLIYFVRRTEPDYIDKRRLLTAYKYMLFPDPKYKFIKLLKDNNIKHEYVKPLLNRLTREINRFIRGVMHENDTNYFIRMKKALKCTTLPTIEWLYTHDGTKIDY